MLIGHIHPLRLSRPVCFVVLEELRSTQPASCKFMRLQSSRCIISNVLLRGTHRQSDALVDSVISPIQCGTNGFRRCVSVLVHCSTVDEPVQYTVWTICREWPSQMVCARRLPIRAACNSNLGTDVGLSGATLIFAMTKLE